MFVWGKLCCASCAPLSACACDHHGGLWLWCWLSFCSTPSHLHDAGALIYDQATCALELLCTLQLTGSTHDNSRLTEMQMGIYLALAYSTCCTYLLLIIRYSCTRISYSANVHPHPGAHRISGERRISFSLGSRAPLICSKGVTPHVAASVTLQLSQVWGTIVDPHQDPWVSLLVQPLVPALTNKLCFAWPCPAAVSVYLPLPMSPCTLTNFFMPCSVCRFIKIVQRATTLNTQLKIGGRHEPARLEPDAFYMATSVYINIDNEVDNDDSRHSYFSGAEPNRLDHCSSKSYYFLFSFLSEFNYCAISMIFCADSFLTKAKKRPSSMLWRHVFAKDIFHH